MLSKRLHLLLWCTALFAFHGEVYYKFCVAVLFASHGAKVHHCIAHRASLRWADSTHLYSTLLHCIFCISSSIALQIFYRCTFCITLRYKVHHCIANRASQDGQMVHIYIVHYCTALFEFPEVVHYKFSIAVLFALLGGKGHHCIAHRASPRWADGIVGKTDGSNRGGKTRKQNRFVQETTPGFSQPQHLRISSCSTVRKAFRYYWILI